MWSLPVIAHSAGGLAQCFVAKLCEVALGSTGIHIELTAPKPLM
jgi:hypothetical protein